MLSSLLNTLLKIVENKFFSTFYNQKAIDFLRVGEYNRKVM